MNLPKDYIDFLINYNACIVKINEQNLFLIDELSKTITIDVLYGLHNGTQNSEISKWMDEYGDELLKNTVIIGDSIQHGFIVLMDSAEFKGIYYWDDTRFFEESSDENNIYLLVDSFSELFNKIL